MTFELVLGVLGLAASAVQMVPLFSTGTPRKLKVVAIFSGVVILGLTAEALWERLTFENKVQALKGDILDHVTRTVSFEDLLGALYYPEYGVLEVAVDGLVTENRMQQRKVSAITESGERVTLRVFEPKR
jgi:hypothetical protein